MSRLLAEDCETARLIALDYQEARRRHIGSLLTSAGALEPDALASQVALLFEGAIASMLVRQDPGVALQARAAALVLLRAGGVRV